jgi:dTDP-4-amino-4,6-dideoxygalactose transaminase
MWKVPLFDISFDEKEVIAAQEVLRSGWLTMGEITQEFEQLFAEFTGVKHAIAVSSCTAALHMANRALEIGQGDEVICPSLTFVAGANSIVYTGAQPVFADITSLNDFSISPQDIETNITPRTKAIQVVHYGGYPCDMDQIMDLAKTHQLHVISDCAHAIGAEYKGKMLGSIGDIGCFSFFSNKNMTTGEGGMITTNNDELAAKIRLMRSHGMTTLTLDRHKGHAFSYDVVELGFNYRIDEIRSAIGIVQLEKLPSGNYRRRELSKMYREKLSDIDGLEIPYKNNYGSSSHHIFPVFLDKNIDRHNFMKHLKDKGIQTSIHYPPIHQFEFYQRNFGNKEGVLPLTEDIAKREVSLPLYPSMGDEDVTYVCDIAIEYLKKGRY